MPALKYSAIALLAALLFSCTDKEVPIKNLLNPDKIPAQVFDIKAGNDTVISTKDGLLLMIKKGTFDTDVKLTLKEALNRGDMLKYGLTTTSDGKPLQTDGMFHISAVDATGKQPKINIPIQASMPANAMLEEPQLFKGEKDKDGFINWINPTDIKNSAQFKSIDLGESVFNSKCVSCHTLVVSNHEAEMPEHGDHNHKPQTDEHSEEVVYPDDNFPIDLNNMNSVGPPLAYVHKRRTYDWFKRFTLSATTVIKSGDACANCVFDKYGQMAMPDQAISDTEMEALWKYIIKESNKLNVDTNSLGYLDCDVEVIKYEAPEYRNDTFNWKQTKMDMPLTGGMQKAKEKELTPNEAYAYSFQISDFGWYNIDQFIKERDGAKESQIDIIVNSSSLYDSLNVALVYKGSQTLIALKPMGDGHYGFHDKYYLPQEKIRLYALGIKDDQLYYDIKDARTTSDGIFKISGELTLKPSTKEQIEDELYQTFKSPPKPKMHLVKCGDVKSDSTATRPAK